MRPFLTPKCHKIKPLTKLYANPVNKISIIIKINPAKKKDKPILMTVSITEGNRAFGIPDGRFTNMAKTITAEKITMKAKLIQTQVRVCENYVGFWEVTNLICIEQSL